MKALARYALAATTAIALAAGPAVVTAGAVTLLAADVAHANNGKGKARGKDKDRGSESRGSSRSAEAKSRGRGPSSSPSARGGAASSKDRADDGLFDFLKPKKKIIVVRQAAPRGPKPSTVTTSPVPAPKPAAIAKADPGADGPGQSWKTRLDGDLTTPSDELGYWNSARRNPRAVANMAAKVREGTISGGAGFAIGSLVVAYEDYNDTVETFQIELDDAIAAALIDEATANRLISGDLRQDAINTTIISLEDQSGAVIAFDDATGNYSCDDSAGGDCSLLEADALENLASDTAIVDALKNDPDYAELADAIDAFGEAGEDLAVANDTVQPMKSVDPLVQETMLGEVLDLLDLEAEEPEEYEISDRGGATEEVIAAVSD